MARFPVVPGIPLFLLIVARSHNEVVKRDFPDVKIVLGPFDNDFLSTFDSWL